MKARGRAPGVAGEGNVFFVKQKTAYEMLRSRVGSEMCIRDSMSKGAGRIEILQFNYNCLGFKASDYYRNPAFTIFLNQYKSVCP